MNEADQLLTIAEIGAALTGFTGIIGALQGGPALTSQRSRVSFWLMLEFSIVTILFALLPVGVMNFDLTGPTVWMLVSGAMAIFIVAHVVVAGRYIMPLTLAGAWPRAYSRTVVPVFGLTALILVLNALGIGFERSFAAYFIGIMLFVVLACLNFVTLMYTIIDASLQQASGD